MLNPNFLLAHRNRYWEGMDDGQKTPLGHPDVNSYVKFYMFSYGVDGRSDRQRNLSGVGWVI